MAAAILNLDLEDIARSQDARVVDRLQGLAPEAVEAARQVLDRDAENGAGIEASTPRATCFAPRANPAQVNDVVKFEDFRVAAATLFGEGLGRQTSGTLPPALSLGASEMAHYDGLWAKAGLASGVVAR